MKKLFILLGLSLAFVFTANAQVAKMSSVFTNLQTDCKAETKSDGDEVPFICKAVGGYRVRIVPAGAWAETVEIVNAKGETVTSLGMVGYGYTAVKNRKIEWRMANGKPFAVIFRVNTYDSEKANEAGDSPFLPKYKTGEKLLIRGLTGHSQIDFEIDGKAKKANLNAQKKADENFQ
jgi:hypothetical protein